MTTTADILCPIPDMGFCIYDQCPYWDQERQECDTDCLKSQEPDQPQSSDGPCIIHWTEDYD